MVNMDNLGSPKHIVITGASRGIGVEIVKNLIKNGHKVLAITRNIGPVSQIAAEYPDHLFYESIDLTLTDVDLSAVIGKHMNRVDVLINNAGALISKPFIDTTIADWHLMLNSNLLSAIAVSLACVPKMGAHSHIVNISSMGGFQGSIKYPGLSAYSTTKGALSILTECLSEELIGLGIHVNALCIGAVQTEMLEAAFPGYKAPISAVEMADYVCDFALKHGRFFNGKIIPVAINNPS